MRPASYLSQEQDTFANTPPRQIMSNKQNSGLLGGLTSSLDNVLTGGEEAKGQAGLLGGVTGAVGSTTEGLGKGLNSTTRGVGNAVGQTTEGLGKTVKGIVGGVGKGTGAATGRNTDNAFRSYGI
ncbi:hypothetical protein GGS21DRAFT_523934 [Xylaria nigripes]|nr:hypothetical protein GGS21DRAFT_523934 [Xylaria nigripes]